MTPEGRVKQAIKNCLNQLNIWYFMPAANGFGKVGVPDFICCFDGKFFAIEAKAPGKRNNTTPNQNMRIQEIKNAGGWVIVVDDITQLEEFLDERAQERLQS